MLKTMGFIIKKMIGERSFNLSIVCGSTRVMDVDFMSALKCEYDADKKRINELFQKHFSPLQVNGKVWALYKKDGVFYFDKYYVDEAVAVDMVMKAFNEVVEALNDEYLNKIK